jgi:ribosomal protein S17
LPYDQTIVATITNNNKAYVGLYQVTTDSNIEFNAYSSNFDYNVGDMVYVRVPGGDYTK